MWINIEPVVDTDSILSQIEKVKELSQELENETYNLRDMVKTTKLSACKEDDMKEMGRNQSMKEHMLKMCWELEKSTEEKAGLIIPGKYTKEEQNRTTKVLTQIVKTLCGVEGMTPETAEWVLTMAADIVKNAAMKEQII